MINRVLVCGGRDYNNRAVVYQALNTWWAVLGFRELVHGAATGVDTLAGEWAQERGLLVIPCPIEPGEGGFARNERMYRTYQPEAVIHFPGGNGTKHMAKYAFERGADVYGGLQTFDKQQELDL